MYIAKKFENTAAGIEDLISIGTIGLMKAINTFKSEKQIKLATYASRCIENEILMYIRKSASQRHEMSLDEPLNIDWDGNEQMCIRDRAVSARCKGGGSCPQNAKTPAASAAGVLYAEGY